MNAEAPVTKSPRSRGAKYNEAAEYTTRGTTGALRPSGIWADHAENGRLQAYDTMPELVKFIGPKCCFSPAQIEKRLTSLLNEGQITPVEIYVTATGQATLVDGYLRHAAFLLAEVRGQLDAIPRAQGKILTLEIKQPKNADDWAAIADRNLAENREREPLTDADMAVWIDRRHAQLVRQFRKDDETLGEKKANGKATEAIADKLKWSVSTVAKYRRLAALKPSTLLAVHTGVIKMSAALSKASQDGEGTHTGPRVGVPHKSVRLALKHAEKRPLPEQGLSSSEKMQEFLAVLAGEVSLDDIEDEDVRAWVSAVSITGDEAKALAPEKPPREAKTPRAKAPRKSPPKPGETAQVDA